MSAAPRPFVGPFDRAETARLRRLNARLDAFLILYLAGGFVAAFAGAFL